ncbi:MAG: hypothetical protein ABI224_16755 [Acetobacteraceae bacterium]
MVPVGVWKLDQRGRCIVAQHLAQEAPRFPGEVEWHLEAVGDGAAVARGRRPVHERFGIAVDVVVVEFDA